MSAARAGIVIFVDARRGDDLVGVQVQALVPPAEGEMSMIHALSPRLLLGLARAAFHRCPSAFLVSVPAEDFTFGEGLSAAAELGLRDALVKIREMIERGPCPEPRASDVCHIVGAPHPPPRSPGPQP